MFFWQKADGAADRSRTRLIVIRLRMSMMRRRRGGKRLDARILKTFNGPERSGSWADAIADAAAHAVPDAIGGLFDTIYRRVEVAAWNQ